MLRRAHDARRRQGVGPQHRIHLLPRHSTLRATSEGSPPRQGNGVEKAPESTQVEGDAVVGVVPVDLLPQRALLHRDGIVPVQVAPSSNVSDAATKAISRCLAHDDPLPGPSRRPEVRETEQIECPRALVVVVVFRRLLRWAPKVEQPRFLWMKRQAVLLAALWQHLEDSSRIRLMCKNHHGVVRVAKEPCRPLQPWLHFTLEPSIEHFV